MKNTLLSILATATLLTACDGMKNKTKETLNKGGEVVGKGATEFLEGVSEGVEKTLDCEIELSQELTDNGLSTGVFSIEDKDTGSNNRLTIYMIFESDFKKTLTAKAYNKAGLEIGRSNIDIDAKAGHAGYFDFDFDNRTDIEARSKIEIE